MTGRNGANCFIVRVYNVQMPHVYRTEAERKRNGNGKNRGTAVQRKRNGNFFVPYCVYIELLESSDF